MSHARHLAAERKARRETAVRVDHQQHSLPSPRQRCVDSDQASDLTMMLPPFSHSSLPPALAPRSPAQPTHSRTIDTHKPRQRPALQKTTTQPVHHLHGETTKLQRQQCVHPLTRSPRQESLRRLQQTRGIRPRWGLCNVRRQGQHPQLCPLLHRARVRWVLHRRPGRRGTQHARQVATVV